MDEPRLKGYTAKELLSKAFSQLNPKNWLHGPDNKYNYFSDDKTRACIVGKCAEVLGMTDRENGDIREIESFLWENGIQVSTLTFENDRAYSLDTFKNYLFGRGWIKS